MTDAFDIRRLKPFGVEIDRDLSQPLNEAEGREFARLLWAHGLIIARNQQLTAHQQSDLCAHLGPILQRQGENGVLQAVPDIDATLSPLRWHSDAAYTDAPFDALALHAVEVVDGETATAFVQVDRAWYALPDDLRAQLADAQTDMISPAYDALATRACDTPDPAAQKRGKRPAIFTNPHNGRDCLWVGELQTARILGMDWADSRNLLDRVYAHLYAAEGIYEHRWHNGDLVIWDNIALQHMRGSLVGCGVRRLQRTIVGTEGVAPHIAAANKQAATA